jgi:hypothetical protein
MKKRVTTIAGLLVWAGAAHGQPVPEPAAIPAQPPALAPPTRLPSLDEALGLAKPGDAGASGVPTRDQTALEEQLSPEQLQDQIAQAVKLMGDAATRVTDAKDVGVETQRLQEEILQKLDKIIEDAKRQQQQQQQKQQQQQQSQDQQQQQQDQQGKPKDSQGKPTDPKQQTGADKQGGNASGDKQGVTNTDPDGKLKPVLSGSATWGNLPPKAREQLMQGYGDTFSSMYRRMTEAYYKRLAEERKRD